ncbi:MAG: hypothetical protein RLN62_05685 [Rickettsiales bacterium]
MFKIAIRDSLVFIKKHFLCFLSLLLLIQANHMIDYQFVFADLTFADFLSIDAFKTYLFLFVAMVLFNLGFSMFYLFKKRRDMTIQHVMGQFKIRFAPLLVFYVFLLGLIAVVSIVMLAMQHMNIMGKVSLFEIYQHFAVSNSFLYFLVSGYIFMYLSFKLVFGLIFAMLDKDLTAVSSIQYLFKRLKYKDLTKIIIAFLAYLFVIASLAEWFVTIIELFMSESSINFFKFGEFNIYGALFYFIKIMAFCIMGFFVISYAMQLHHKFHHHGKSGNDKS